MIYEGIHPIFEGAKIGGDQVLREMCDHLDDWVMIEGLRSPRGVVRVYCPICEGRQNKKDQAVYEITDAILKKYVFVFESIMGSVHSVIYAGECERCHKVLWFPVSMTPTMWTPEDYLMRLNPQRNKK